MNPKRLLFPFTHGVDKWAIEHALQLAQERQATLVPLALIRIPDSRTARGGAAIRLEHIQQAKDFLETVRYAAPKYHVAIESHEIATPNVIHSIATQARRLGCESVILLTNERGGLLLQTYEIATLLHEIPVPCDVIHVQPSKAGRKSLQQFVIDSLLANTEVLTAVGQVDKR